MLDLLTALIAFSEEHRRCYQLYGDGLDSGHDASYVWLSCACGAVMVQPLKPTPLPKVVQGSFS